MFYSFEHIGLPWTQLSGCFWPRSTWRKQVRNEAPMEVAVRSYQVFNNNLVINFIAKILTNTVSGGAGGSWLSCSGWCSTWTVVTVEENNCIGLGRDLPFSDVIMILLAGILCENSCFCRIVGPGGGGGGGVGGGGGKLSSLTDWLSWFVSEQEDSSSPKLWKTAWACNN